MINKKIWSAFAAFFAIVCIFSSCNNGMQGLLDDLNDTLPVQNFPASVPGSEDFNPEEMLGEKYFVGSDATICLSAPNATTYLWQVYRIKYEMITIDGYVFEKEVFEEIVVGDKIPITKRLFNLYIPDVETEMTPGTYKLVLTVKDDFGTEYTDVAQLIVYKPCHKLQ